MRPLLPMRCLALRLCFTVECSLFGFVASANPKHDVFSKSIPLSTNCRDVDYVAASYDSFEEAALALQKAANAQPSLFNAGRNKTGKTTYVPVSAVIGKDNITDRWVVTPLRADNSMRFNYDNSRQSGGLFVSEKLKERMTPFAYYQWNRNGVSSDLAPYGMERADFRGPTISEMGKAQAYRDEYHPYGLPLIKDNGSGEPLVYCEPKLDNEGRPDFTPYTLDSQGNIEELNYSELGLSKYESGESRKRLNTDRTERSYLDNDLPAAPAWQVENTFPAPDASSSKDFLSKDDLRAFDSLLSTVGGKDGLLEEGKVAYDREREKDRERKDRERERKTAEQERLRLQQLAEQRRKAQSEQQKKKDKKFEQQKDGTPATTTPAKTPSKVMSTAQPKAEPLSSSASNSPENESNPQQPRESAGYEKITIDVGPIDGAGTVLENYANNPALMLGAGAKELVQVEMSAGDKWYREWKAKLSALPDGHPQKAQAMQFVEQVYSEFCKLKAKF